MAPLPFSFPLFVYFLPFFNVILYCHVRVFTTTPSHIVKIPSPLLLFDHTICRSLSNSHSTNHSFHHLFSPSVVFSTFLHPYTSFFLTSSTTASLFLAWPTPNSGATSAHIFPLRLPTALSSLIPFDTHKNCIDTV